MNRGGLRPRLAEAAKDTGLEKRDAETLIARYANAGTKYFVSQANHHDNFDNYASTIMPGTQCRSERKKSSALGRAPPGRTVCGSCCMFTLLAHRGGRAAAESICVIDPSSGLTGYISWLVNHVRAKSQSRLRVATEMSSAAAASFSLNPPK